jgi:hypothetical protein
MIYEMFIKFGSPLTPPETARDFVSHATQEQIRLRSGGTFSRMCSQIPGEGSDLRQPSRNGSTEFFDFDVRVGSSSSISEKEVQSLEDILAEKYRIS